MRAEARLSYPADGVALIAMYNPPRNFGSGELIERVDEAVQTARDAGTRVLVLTSDLPGYFIAHALLSDIIARRTGGTPTGDFAAWGRVGRELRLGPMVSIAANPGQAWGGGSELSWTCNLRMAAESATYGQPEVLLGIIPGGGGTTRLARLVGEARCMEMILDGKPISAQTALAWGLVNRVVPDDRLRDEAIAWAVELASRPWWAVQACKRSLLKGLDLSFRDAIMNEGKVSGEISDVPEALELLRTAQAKYDAGSDSYEVFDFERP